MSEPDVTAVMPPAEETTAFRKWLRSTFASLYVRNFRLFYIGQGLSLVGTWMRRTVFGWIVYEMTQSYEMVGTVMALTMVPLLLFSPLAGVVADRMDKRTLIIWTQVAASLTSALVALLLFWGKLEIWHAMILAFVGGASFAMEVPARQAFVVEMVGRENLLNAIGLNSALVNAGRIIGPALGGFLMSIAGAGVCFLFDSVTYLIVIWTLLAMGLERRSFDEVKKPHPLRHFAEGLREVWTNRLVRSVLLLLFMMGVLGWNFQTLLPAMAQDELGIGEFKYGIMMSVFGIGAICAALCVATRSEKSDRHKLMMTGSMIMSVSLILMSLSSNYHWMIAMLAGAGFGGVLFISSANTVIQLTVADNIRGRVMGVWALGFGGSLPLGSWIAGYAAGWIGSFNTLRASGVILLCASTGIFRFMFRTGAGSPSADV